LITHLIATFLFQILILPHFTPISAHRLLDNHASFSTHSALVIRYSNLDANLSKLSVLLVAQSVSVAKAAAKAHLEEAHATNLVAPAPHSTIAKASEATQTGSCSIAFANASQLPYLAANAFLHSSVQNNCTNHAAVSIGFVNALVTAETVLTVEAGIFAYILALLGQLLPFNSSAAPQNSQLHQLTSLLILSINQLLNHLLKSSLVLSLNRDGITFPNCSRRLSHSTVVVYN
jgi:hypothetical protein